MLQDTPLTENDKEALVIRWRRIVTLCLVDFFNVSNDFGKLTIKEFVDMRECVIKAYAKSHGVPLFAQSRWRKYEDIVRDLKNLSTIPADIKQGITLIENFFTSKNFSFQNLSFSLKDIRNEETHYLNFADIPKETVFRVWRVFIDLINLIDPNFFNYVKCRPEICDFYHLYDFFKRVALEGNRDGLDLNEVKKTKAMYHFSKLDRKLSMAEIESEQGIWEIIKAIKQGKYSFNVP